MKIIIVDHGTKKQLMSEGLGSYPTIREALNCRSNTEVARKIRQRALQLGGVVMETERVKKELEEAFDKDGELRITCQFCNTTHVIKREDMN